MFNIRLIVIVLFLGQAYGASENAYHHPTRLIVKMRGQTGFGSLKTESVLPNEDLSAAEARLRSRKDVEYVEKDILIEGLMTPNDTDFAQQWAMLKTNANVAWDKTTGAAAVKLCMADTGTQFDHPDLNGQIVSNYNVLATGQPANDDNGHGTANAGILSAIGGNALGIAGMSWKLSLSSCKWLDSTNRGYMSNAILCLDWCHYTVGARISSASWGTTTSTKSLSDKLSEITKAGHLVVAAAGNNGWNMDSGKNKMYPAAYNLDGILAVTALDSNDNLPSWGNYGANSVDMGAPGVGIYTTNLGGGYSTRDGTSFSAPHVAGAAALLKSVNPSLTNLQLKAALMNSGRPVASLSGKTVSGKALDVAAAVNAATVRKLSRKILL